MKSGLSTGAVKRISAVLSLINADFPKCKFRRDALDGLEQLELKQRVEHIITVLSRYLPSEFTQAADTLLQVKHHWDWGDESDALSGFAAWPLIDYVAVYGLKDPELALRVLKNLTPLFSAEFAIRPFIEQHFELVHQILLVWCEDDDEHVRRLASEGIRPRLPWGKQLTQLCDDPSAIFPILELLKDDSSLYVRKSVANNLNDITKDNPDSVIALCQQWQVDSTVERAWIIRHGLRSLIKQGRAEVFPLLGYTENPKLELSQFQLEKNCIKLGEQLSFLAVLLSKSSQTQKCVIDYRVHHVKSNGRTTCKVFKWKNITLPTKESITLMKVHPFKRITTRTYYAGQHAIEILINGQSMGKISFDLVLE